MAGPAAASRPLEGSMVNNLLAQMMESLAMGQQQPGTQAGAGDQGKAFLQRIIFCVYLHA
jgi:hypothetical protein